jgi:hypothetical protein
METRTVFSGMGSGLIIPITCLPSMYTRAPDGPSTTATWFQKPKRTPEAPREVVPLAYRRISGP